MDEFSIIEKFFKPLTAQGGPALNLENDTAVYSPPDGFDLILTKDAMIEGVHFLKGTDPSKVARKLLRVNLSDLAAAGAKPVGYLLAIMAPKDLGPDWFQGFVDGLMKDQKEFGISLFGGDTTSGAETLSLSLTALGIVPKGKALTRAGARAGDDLYVSGKIGAAALGLKMAKGELEADPDILRRYELPDPRVALGQKLVGIASAAMDISDGLFADLNHLCRASGVGAEINTGKIPKPDRLGDDPAGLGQGDDYELLFTAAGGRAGDIATLSSALNLPLAKINVENSGYRHFSRDRDV